MQHYKQLIPFRKTDQWGFANQNREIVIKPVYDQVSTFSGNIALVIKEGKFGLISNEGKEILKPEYDLIGDDMGYLCNEDYSITIIKDNQYGLVSCHGDLLIDAEFDDEQSALSAAQKRGWNGAVPHHLLPKIPFSVIKNIEAIKEIKDGIIPFRQNNLWGLMDIVGKIITPPQFDDILGVENGCRPFQANGKWGLLNSDGKIALEAKFENTRGFSNGQAACKLNELWGAVDLSGEWVYEPQYTELGEFREGLSAARKNDLYGFVDEFGKVIIDFQFEYVLDFYEGKCAVLEENDVYFINTSGEKVSETYQRYAGPDENLFLHVMKEGKWGLVKPNGEFLLPIIYDLPVAMGQAIHEISDNMIPIKKGALLGYADMSGNEIVPPKYVTIDPFCEGLSRVCILHPEYNPGKTPESMEAASDISGVFSYGFIDRTGKEVIPLQYTSAGRFVNGITFVNTLDTSSGYIAKDGTEYFED
ncbi:MAG: WG repeat-containing protein [Bacteroidota bacterium]